MSLRLRTGLLVTLLTLVFLATVGAVAFDILKSSIREEMEAATKVTSQTLRTAAQLADGEHFQQYLQALGRVRANEVLLYGGEGELLYRSPPSIYKKDRYAPAWFAGLVDPRPTRITLPLAAGSLVIVPDPSRAILDAWDDARSLFGVMLGFFAGVWLLAHWLVGRTLRPVENILQGLNEMERGNFSARLPAFSLPELARVGKTFNRMAETLEFSLSENRRLEHDQQVAALVRSRLEEERKAVARELHDELGQCVTAIKTIAVSISHRTRDTAPEIHGSAQTIASVSGHIYDAVHGIITRLRTGQEDAAGVEAPLRELIDTWQSRHPDTQVALRLDGPIEGLGEDVSLTVFRIVQESLTNIARHAAATRVDVELTRTGEGLQVSVRDNGKGMSPQAAATPRFGLVGMRERVEVLQGELLVESKAGHGVLIRAVLPIVGKEENIKCN